jgi:hypothetical protein
MISSEVQRTLVKSPPELWAEISDPESLARHLGEFGEIRITRVQPEQRVEWEADDTSGTVVIKPSGWGTKVKLTVTRELAELDAQDDPEAEAATEDAAKQIADEQEQQAMHEPPELTQKQECPAELDGELEPDVDDTPTVEPALELEPFVEPESNAEPHAEDEQREELEPMPPPKSEPEPRRGFFARLFGRRHARAEEPSPNALAEPESESKPFESEPLADGLEIPHPDFELDTELTAARGAAPGEQTDEPVVTGAGLVAEHPSAQDAEQPLDAPENLAGPSEEQAQADDAAARAKLAEELAAEGVTAVLTGVLDRLGAAHHRPFSRA